MKLVTLSMAVAAACVFGQAAQARGYHQHRYGYRHHASRHALSERYMEQPGYASEDAAAGRGWGQSWSQGWSQRSGQGSGHGWPQWPSASSDEWRRSARAERRAYTGDADESASERRRFFSRRTARYGERGEGRGEVSRNAERTDYRGGYGARPSAWCGWEMRHLVGADPGPQFNLARNWAHWGHAGPAGVGAVVVWPHHVGKIVGRDGNGQWVIRSGNDGHRVRTRPRSIGGAIAIRWG